VNSYACVPFHLGEARYQQQGAAARSTSAIHCKRSRTHYQRRPKQDTSNVYSLQLAAASLVLIAQTSFDRSALDILTTLFEAQDDYVELMRSRRPLQASKKQTHRPIVLKTQPKPCYYAFTLKQ